MENWDSDKGIVCTKKLLKTSKGFFCVFFPHTIKFNVTLYPYVPQNIFCLRPEKVKGLECHNGEEMMTRRTIPNLLSYEKAYNIRSIHLKTYIFYHYSDQGRR